LLKKCVNMFPSEGWTTNGQMIRSMYTAVLKDLSNLAMLGKQMVVLYHVFAGTFRGDCLSRWNTLRRMRCSKIFLRLNAVVTDANAESALMVLPHPSIEVFG